MSFAGMGINGSWTTKSCRKARSFDAEGVLSWIKPWQLKPGQGGNVMEPWNHDTIPKLKHNCGQRIGRAPWLRRGTTRKMLLKF